MNNLAIAGKGNHLMRISVENEYPVTLRDKSGHIGQFSRALAFLKKIADELSLRRKEKQLILISHPDKTEFVNLGRIGKDEKKLAGLLSNTQRLFQDQRRYFFSAIGGRSLTVKSRREKQRR